MGLASLRRMRPPLREGVPRSWLLLNDSTVAALLLEGVVAVADSCSLLEQQLLRTEQQPAGQAYVAELGAE